MWDAALAALRLPPVDRALVDRIRGADPHWYAGSRASVEALRAALPPDTLAALVDPEAGRPDAR